MGITTTAVRFEPLHGQQQVFLVDLWGISFVAGEVKKLGEAPDNLTADDIAKILTNPNFVDDETGLNPVHACATCSTTYPWRLDQQDGWVRDSQCGTCDANNTATIEAARAQQSASPAPPAPAAVTPIAAPIPSSGAGLDDGIPLSAQREDF